MPLGKEIGKSAYALFIDPLGGTDYSNIICLTDFNIALSNSTNTKTTMCGTISSPGDQSVTIPLNGVIEKDVTTNEISAPDLFDLAQDSRTFSWKIQAVDPVALDITKEGRGYFSSYNENYTGTDFAAFGATIAVSGPIVQTIESGS